MDVIKIKIKSALNYILTFLRWVVLASITGCVGGIIGTVFHKSVELVTEIRLSDGFMIFLLPLGGLLIAILYKKCNISDNTGTNYIIESMRTDDKVPVRIAPLIFVSTVITHLFGGSAGREGAALQLGGGIGSQIGRIFHLDDKDTNVIVMCGMSSVFSALFGTPLTAAIFAMGVISIGITYYSTFLPCLVASIVSYLISIYFGIKPIRYVLSSVPDLSLNSIGYTVLLAALCALLSIVFCVTMRKTEVIFEKIKNKYLRIFTGGILVVLLTLIVGIRDYNGIGMDIIENAMIGNANPEAFLLKIIFTALTIGAGYKGGEIVPTFFIGSTFGCTFGIIFGINPGFCAAIGLISLFCGVLNVPIAAIVLSVEVFGSEGLLLFAIASSVSYMLSGYYSLYRSQKIIYSKLKTEFININAK
ncbi:chloride channel protein [Ruminiclostridium herbifermentans]|uniref:Chloride channel protein n=1 Tax=Ruminiclostridium herbifermentans TaxID=2488810 RepID=A0A4U7JHK9_9FIRM|nr:chloride channel protein [Ruminiclostridium herbifermentans]QNU66093.1 chloride channel protein [Ruminiclostridium herbifermentans]